MGPKEPGGRPLSPTPSEFGLLNVLIACPERVFSRSELLDSDPCQELPGPPGPSPPDEPAA